MNKIFSIVFIITLLTGCTDSEKSAEKEKNTETGNSFIMEAGSALPYLTRGWDGRLYLSYVVEVNDTAYFKYRVFEDDTWSAPLDITSGTDWFVNWADYPMMSVNSTGRKLAHFLAKSAAGTYSYDVNLVRNTGNEWSDPMIVHKDGTPTEHGFVTMFPLDERRFQVAWLDGRNTETKEDGSRDPMTLRSAILSIEEGTLSQEVELDNSTCDCCQTTGVLTDNGPVIFYRDRSGLEIRDIYVTRKTAEGWSEPKPVFQDNWNIAGCPVNGPRATAMGNNLAVAWFTSANNSPMVKVSFSSDGGETFEEPIILDQTNPMGRVDIVLLEKDLAEVIWLDREDEKDVIKYARVSKNGSLERSGILQETSGSRASGFPQSEMVDKWIFYAFTTLDKDQNPTIRVIRSALTN